MRSSGLHHGFMTCNFPEKKTTLCDTLKPFLVKQRWLAFLGIFIYNKIISYVNKSQNNWQILSPNLNKTRLFITAFGACIPLSAGRTSELPNRFVRRSVKSRPLLRKASRKASTSSAWTSLGKSSRKRPGKQKHKVPLPETNSSPLKMDGWNTTFLLGRPIFSGYVSFREGIFRDNKDMYQ